MDRLGDNSRLLCGALVGILFATATASAAQVEVAGVDAIVRKAIDAKSLPGAAVAIEESGKVTFSKAYGVADLQTQAPVSAATTFRLGSISKLITAVAIMRLVEERRLSLEAPVARLLPNHPQASRLPEGVTVRHLLNHTAGLNDISGVELRSIVSGSTTPDSAAAVALARPLIHEPGAEWSYANVGYWLLSQILERQTGKSFGRYIVEELAPALGMRSLRLCGSDDPRWAKGYEPKEGRFVPEAAYTVAGLLGEGGLCASAEDLVRLPAALL